MKVCVGAVRELPLQGLLKKSQESILSCVHAFEFHSPLEGESKRPSGLCEGRFGGGSFSVACPPTNSPAGFALVSLTPPQGGSEIRCALSVDFFNNPLRVGLPEAKAGIHFMIFAFVFAFDSASRDGAPRPSPERMRWICMAASVSSPAGSEDVRAKSQRQRRKWIPAFAGMTAKARKASRFTTTT